MAVSWDLTWGCWPEHMTWLPHSLAALGEPDFSHAQGSKGECPAKTGATGSPCLSQPQNSCSQFCYILLGISKSQAHLDSKGGYIDTSYLMG